MNETRREIFVVGCPRSGTTLLQSMLASHPALRAFPESHILVAGVGRQGRQLFGWLKRLRILRQLSADTQTSIQLSAFEKLRILCDADYYLERALALMDVAAPKRASAGWIEKTPEHLFFIQAIGRVRPRARFVHIIRENGAELACSVVSMWSEVNKEKSKVRKVIEAVNDVRIILCSGLLTEFMRLGNLWRIFLARRYLRAYILWCDCLEVSVSRLGLANHFHIFLRDLTIQPETKLDELCGWLGIPYNKKMLSYQASVQHIVRPDEAWKADNSSALKVEQRSRANELSESESLFFRALQERPLSKVRELLSALASPNF